MNYSKEIEEFKNNPAVRKIVIAHSEVALSSSLFIIAFDWLVIAAGCALAHYFPHPLVYLFAIGIIATRQHALLVVMHEAAHYRLSKNRRLNDGLANYFAAYPTFISTEGYRKHHTSHHRHTNTHQDPDWVRKAPLAEWQYPQSARMIAATLTKQLAVGGWQWVKLMAIMSKNDYKKILYWSVIVGLVSVFKVWPEFLLLWMVPLLTLFPTIQRIRSISEHFGLPLEHEFNGTRNILAGPAERFLFSPHHVNLHLAHHLFPSVPQHRLPSLHKEFMKFPTYNTLAHNNDSFFWKKQSVYNDLRSTKKNNPTRSAA